MFLERIQLRETFKAYKTKFFKTYIPNKHLKQTKIMVNEVKNKLTGLR